MNKDNHYKVTIFSEQYSLVTDESKENLEHLAHSVNLIMKRISEDTATTNVKTIAVLALLEVVHEMRSLEKKVSCIEERHNKINHYINNEI